MTNVYGNVEANDVSTVNKEVYEAEDIAKMLGLGRSKTYEFLNEVYNSGSPFVVFKIGKLMRVPKYSFDQWLFGGVRKEAQ